MEELIISLTKGELEDLIESTVSRVLKAYQATQTQPQSSSDPDKEILTVQEAADLFRVTPASIHAWKREGKLKFFRRGRRIYFKRSEIL
ncbi:MAG: helix-turn-helix domain-containing protein [Bacteroidota bacterium]